MPIPKPNFDPPFNVLRASHVEFGVTDLALSRAFYVDCLGYNVTAEDRDAIYLRGIEERNHHSIVLSRAPDPLARAIGFKVASEDDLDKAARYFERRGLRISWPELPHQGRTLRVVDPVGMPVDFYASMERVPSLHQKYGTHRGARVTRIDHINCFTPDVQKSVDFFSNIGFRVTEYTDTSDGRDLWAVWMHRKGTVHDIAFTNGYGPRLHHIGVYTAEPMDIVRICDVMATTGYLKNMERGPGRHGISNAFFLYVRDPDGHRVEFFTSDYQTMDPEHEPIRWDLRDPTRQTLWGQPAPRSWFEEGSLFPGTPVREPVLKAEPIVAP
jgi:catechol 2,3-dioxygenase